MKNIQHILLTGVVCASALTLAAGCNNFLDDYQTPPSTVVPDDYLWSAEQLGTYTVSYYVAANDSNEEQPYDRNSAEYGGRLPSHSGTGGESPYLKDDYGTDDAVSRDGNTRFIRDAWTTGATGGYWNFKNIYALNYYLETVVPRYEAGQITGAEKDVRHYIGEGYFLRAHEYFFRLKNLGDFPIIKTTLPVEEERLIAESQRQPRSEVARFILDDLGKAIDLLNDSPAGGKSRITRNAALLLKARVALFEATWERYHAGTARVPLGPGWPGFDKEYSKNYQFKSGSAEAEVDFFLDEAMKAAKEVAGKLVLTDNNKVDRQKASDAKNPYYNMFSTSNTTELDGYPEVIMYRGYNSSLKKHWFNHYIAHGGNRGFTHQLEQVFLTENGLPVYAAGNTQYAGDDYVADTKKNRDWRWRLFMKAPNDVVTVDNIGTPAHFPEAPSVYLSDGKTGTSTGYIMGKGLSHDDLMGANNKGGEDITAFVVFRAAEAYLIYIEACIEKTGDVDADATAYWEALRTRAGISTDFRATIANTDMAKEGENDWGAYSRGELVSSIVYNIRRERRCELLGEGMRYDDLLRWRAMDQLDGFQLMGCKIWGPMKELAGFKNDDGTSKLLSDQADETKNTVSSPNDGLYNEPLRLRKANNQYYNGFSFCGAHYLQPIAAEHFIKTASDRRSPELSPIYQNPGWSTTAGAAPDYSK